MPSASSKKSPSLPELQQWMRRVLTHPEGVSTALSKKSRPDFAHVIGETPTLARAERLSIYGNCYFWRLIDCLRANYSAVNNALGPERFYRVAHDYLVKFPSRYKCIDDVGKELPNLLRRHPVIKGKPYAVELATLEWTVHESIYADDVPPLNPKRFADLTPQEWARTRLILDPSVRLLQLDWPVDKLWQADGKWTQARLKKIRPSKVLLLVYRRNDKLVRVPRLTKTQFDLLKRLQAGETLGEAVTAMAQGGVPPLKQWFNDWMTWGLIRNIAEKITPP